MKRIIETLTTIEELLEKKELKSFTISIDGMEHYEVKAICEAMGKYNGDYRVDTDAFDLTVTKLKIDILEAEEISDLGSIHHSSLFESICAYPQARQAEVNIFENIPSDWDSHKDEYTEIAGRTRSDRRRAW